MSNDKPRIKDRPSSESSEPGPDESTELEESDLESVAGGVTWHPDTVESVSYQWEGTPDG